MSEEYRTIRVTRDERGVATVTMDRPEVRNAFDDRLIAELTAAGEQLGAEPDVRVVVLTGGGEVFSAGADLHWMSSMKEYSFDDNVADATRMNTLFRTLYDLPKPLVARVNGHAIAGGTGLVSVCDIAVAVRAAMFGFTEVAVGIAPAVISPYAVRKVGRSFARSVFVTGERFGAQRAYEAGLVHEVVDDLAALDDAVAAAVERCLRAGPQAAAAAKTLPDLALADLDTVGADTARVIAGLRVSDEGQEGMAAFLDKRRPSWHPDNA